MFQARLKLGEKTYQEEREGVWVVLEYRSGEVWLADKDGQQLTPNKKTARVLQNTRLASLPDGQRLSGEEAARRRARFVERNSLTEIARFLRLEAVVGSADTQSPLVCRWQLRPPTRT